MSNHSPSQGVSIPTKQQIDDNCTLKELSQPPVTLKWLTRSWMTGQNGHLMLKKT